MNTELTDSLISKYPSQFKNLNYIECGDGWFSLINILCSVVQDRLSYSIRQGKDIDFFWWSQIKEKFGGLRAYCYGADDYIRGAIDLSQSISYSICELSGDKGKPRKQRLGDNGEILSAWIKTLSDQEATKNGYL